MWAALVAIIGAMLFSLEVLELSASIGLYVLWAVLIWWLPKPQWGLWPLLGLGFLLRSLLWSTEPFLSDDIFRYIWEGQLTAAGGNPYLTPPSDFQPVDSRIHANINHPEIPSIYPPVAMIFFAFIASLSSTIEAMKAAFLLVDMLCLILIYRLSQVRKQGSSAAWLYALHPLPIVELSGSGHMDGLGILFLLLALWAYEHQKSSAFWLVMGGGVKLLPAVLLPRTGHLKDRGLWFGLVLLVAMSLPFLQAPLALTTALRTYAEHWSFNGSFFVLLQPITGGQTRMVLAIVGMGILIYGLRRQFELDRLALWVCGASIVLSPTVHPWYVLWVWVPALLCENRTWTVLASLVPLSYVALLTLDPATGQWDPPLWPSLVIYGIFGGTAVVHYCKPLNVDAE